MNLNPFSQKVFDLSTRISYLLEPVQTYSLDPTNTPSCYTELALTAFKLGVALEELQIAIEEIEQQHEELMAAVEEAAIERERYQHLFEFSPQAHFVTSLEGTIQEANRMASQLLGVSAEFLIGKPLVLFINKSDRAAYWEELARRKNQDYFQEWVLRIKPRNQDAITVACTTVAIRDRMGQPTGFRWMIQDITARRRLETLMMRHDSQVTLTSDAIFSSDYPRQQFTTGEMIPLRPQPLWFVEKGLVKLTTLTEQNRTVLLGLVGPETPFGAFFTSLPIYEAIAQSDVQLVLFSLDEITNSPQLAQLLLARTAHRLQQTECLLGISGEMKAEKRLHQFLQLLKREVGQPAEQGIRLSVRLTHEDIASACGSTRVTITRLLGRLQSQGKLTLDDKSHIILLEL